VALALEQVRLRRQMVDKVTRLAHERGLLGRHCAAPTNRAKIRSGLSKARTYGLTKEAICAASLNGRMRDPTGVEAGTFTGMLAVLGLATKRQTTAALGFAFAFRGLQGAAGLLIFVAAIVFSGA